MLEIYDTPLDVMEILNRWYIETQKSNCGAFINFIGVVRDEDSIDGLSFDLYMPILEKWFDTWKEEALNSSAKILMAHSRGDVLIGESSFLAAVISPKRRVALALIGEFVEDFKANAPIWKYDIRDGTRIYAKERSSKITGAGVLA